MPGSTPPTSQLDGLSSTTAMIVLFWSRATRDLLRSFGWGIAALHREYAATKLPFPRRPPHSVFRSRSCERLFWALPIGDGGTKGGATYRFRSETAMLAWSGCQSLSLAEGPRVRIRLPPAASQERTPPSRDRGRP